jgi:hypothetical protein
MDFSRLTDLFTALCIPDTVEVSSRSCILLSCHDVDRGLAIKGRYFSPILNSIGEYYKVKGNRVVNFSHPFTLYKTHQVLDGMVSINRRYFLYSALAKLESIFLGTGRALKRRELRLVKVYHNVLCKLKPAIIFSIQPPPELSIAAHQRGIAVVEPMHGMNFHPRNEIFRSWIEGVDDKRLPSAYLAFDDRTYESLRELIAGRSIRVFRIPHPWHIEVNRGGSCLVADDSSLISRLAGCRAAFLISLQWGYDGERESVANIVPNGIMHPSLEAAIRSSPKDILWLVRLHPVQIKRRRYSRHRQYVQELAHRFSSVEWRLASTLPLPMLLSVCHGHISMSSGSVGEAALLGVPSLMLCPTLKQGSVHEGLFEELVESGILKLGELDEAKIGAWITKHSDQVKRPQQAWKTQIQELHNRLNMLLEKFGVA